MDKVKEAINKIREEYQKRIGELLTEEYEFNEGSIDAVSALSNAHSLEAGVHTLNTLERILDDREYASKEWGIKNTETKPPIETILKYDVICSGVYLEGDTAMVYISNTMLNELFDELYARRYIENKSLSTIKFKIENDGSIIANTDLGKMVIPPLLFEEMVKEAIIKGNLTISSSINQTLRGSWMNELEIEMKPKTEEEEED